MKLNADTGKYTVSCRDCEFLESQYRPWWCTLWDQEITTPSNNRCDKLKIKTELAPDSVSRSVERER